MLRLKKWFLKKTPIQEKSQSAWDGVEKIIPTQRINYCFLLEEDDLCRGLWKSYTRKAGYAYFEMNFNKPIYSVLYSVGFWSNSENLDGTAALKIKDSNGNWTQMTNLLSLQLNARGQGLKRYSNYFPNGIYGLKFECTATATGSRNMGRLSIDDIVFGMKAGSNDNNYYITNYRKTVA